MNQTDTNKRIAEKCGLINQGKAKGVPALEHKWYRMDEGKAIQVDLPNYTESLDAIREAVLAQGGDFQAAFAFRLYRKARELEKHQHQLSAADWCAAFLAVVASTTASSAVEGRGE